MIEHAGVWAMDAEKAPLPAVAVSERDMSWPPIAVRGEKGGP